MRGVELLGCRILKSGRPKVRSLAMLAERPAYSTGKIGEPYFGVVWIPWPECLSPILSATVLGKQMKIQRGVPGPRVFS